MTIEEIIKWLESLKVEIGKSEHRTLWHYAEAIDIAIEVLSKEKTSRCVNLINKLPSVDTPTESINTQTDLISRADVITKIPLVINETFVSTAERE